jgi:ATP synthase protein I
MVYNLFDEPQPDEENAESLRSPEDNFVATPFEPDSADETFRRTGLAWSAGIVFFGSVVFMLGLGWLADLVFGSTPWGLVGGIVLGSGIGFYQFFRISSQIFGSEKSKDDMPSFLPTEDEKDK